MSESLHDPDSGSGAAQEASPAQRRRRPPETVRRARRVKVKLSDAELAAVQEGAARDGMAPVAWLAAVALEQARHDHDAALAAEHAAAHGLDPARAAAEHAARLAAVSAAMHKLGERRAALMASTALLEIAGRALNAVTATANATGHVPAAAAAVIGLVGRRVADLDLDRATAELVDVVTRIRSLQPNPGAGAGTDVSPE